MGWRRLAYYIIMTYISNKDFFIEVAKGNVAKHSLYHLHPRNSNVGLVSEDVTPMSATYVSPTTYRTVTVVSSSANDTAAGTGMRTIEITGTTANGIESEVLTLNGTTQVTSTKSYACIIESEGETWGSTLNNVGNITITSTTDLTVQNLIPATFNEAYSGVFMCPAGYKAYLLSWNIDAQNVTSTTQVDFFLFKKNNFSGGWSGEDDAHLYVSGTSSVRKEYRGGILIQPMRFIKTQVISSVAASDCSASYEILLVQD